MDVIVRALIKSRVPGPHIGKSGCRLEKCRATTASSFYIVCARTPNRSCLTLYDVKHYNDVTSILTSYVSGRNIRFIGV